VTCTNGGRAVTTGKVVHGCGCKHAVGRRNGRRVAYTSGKTVTGTVEYWWCTAAAVVSVQWWDGEMVGE